MTQVSGSRGRGRPPSGAEIESAVPLRAALAAFAERGYDGVSVRELGRELRISHAQLNARFGSKRNLWYAAVSHVLSALDQDLRAVARRLETDGLEALREAIVRHVTFAAAHPELLRIMR
jgi:TetR/AcrR family transcriptional regulator